MNNDQTFKHITKLKTSKDSIFYSIIKHNNKIIGIGRKKYDLRSTKVIMLDEGFNVINDSNKDFIKAEDPRIFYHKQDGNNILYMVDNTLDDIHLHQISHNVNKIYKLDIKGKNFSFISHNNNLYFIHTMIPFALYKIIFTTKTKNNIYETKLEKQSITNNTNNIIGDNDEYRGGTVGYPINKNNYYGYGHRTYYVEDDNNEQQLKHDIFYWEVNFDVSLKSNNIIRPSIKIKNIKQPKKSRNITDPTSVIELNNKKYLITAESDKSWFCEQEYITNVYEFKNKN